MSAPASAMHTLAPNYDLIQPEDMDDLKKWLNFKAEIEDINNIPRRKTAERRRMAEEKLLQASIFEKLFEKYNFLAVEFFKITKTLAQYTNEQVKPLELAAERYFRKLFDISNREILGEPKFLPKHGGDQLGKIMRLEYIEKESKAKNTVNYYIKTHQGGAKSGQSSTDVLDPKEILMYKVLEFIGIGPKTHFFFNPLSQGGFYIATQDAGFSELKTNQSQQSFVTLAELKEKVDNATIEKMQDIIHSGLATADILSRIFYLRDVITNTGNSGFVLDSEQNQQTFKVIDFTVMDTNESYASDGIFEGYMSRNGKFNYVDDPFLKKYINDLTDQKKIEIAIQLSRQYFLGTDQEISLKNAIDEAAKFTIEFVNSNKVSLGIEIPDNPRHDFNRYVTDVKLSLGKFLNDLHSKTQELPLDLEQVAAAASAHLGRAQLHQYQNVIHQQSNAETSASTKEKLPPTGPKP